MVGDRARQSASPRSASARRQLQVRLQHAQLRAVARARALGARKRSHARAKETARAPAAAVRGEHQAHAARRGRCEAPTMISCGADPGQHRLARAQRQAVDGEAEVFDQ